MRTTGSTYWSQVGVVPPVFRMVFRMVFKMLFGMLFGVVITMKCLAAPVPGILVESPATRVISLDYCADQFLLKLLPKERILALSPDAAKPFSYMRHKAEGMPTVRPIAEDVLISRPDLVVRSYGGGPNMSRFLEQAGVNVLQVGYANSFDDVKHNIRALSVSLGVERTGNEVIDDMERRLERLSRVTRTPSRRALYVTPGGVTAGPQTLIHEMIELAGLENFQTQSGWRQLPLERLAFEKPDILITAFYRGNRHQTNSWSASNHPLITSQLASFTRVDIDGATTSCGGWFLLDAIEAMSAAALADDDV